MKTRILFGIAVFVLGFILSADLVAGEKETEKMLIKQGWVKLSPRELWELKNHTFVGEMGGASYVDPTGTQLVLRSRHGIITRSKRIVTLAGEICFKSESVKGYWRCRSVWKRGKYYIRLKTEDGTLSLRRIIKPGNTENL